MHGRVNTPVLVLNQNYEPLNVTSARRAIVLLDRGKAEVLEHGRGTVRSTSQSHPLPSVIRLIYLIRRPRPQVRLSRREVFLRDGYTCQYCGVKSRDLTLDHVRATPTRRQACLGESGERLQGVQPSQGKPDTRGGADAPAAGTAPAKRERLLHLRLVLAATQRLAQVSAARRLPRRRGVLGERTQSGRRSISHVTQPFRR
ncbi:MAG: hypothetical protein KatS3mg060_2698 [Dehalococcoidia bacterium]|nr:MAG: hypothetical protein KatS3mg060_2698 [Dehalococcoidia bacterium]